MIKSIGGIDFKKRLDELITSTGRTDKNAWINLSKTLIDVIKNLGVPDKKTLVESIKNVEKINL